MLRPYVDVLRRPGALRFSAAGLLARMPISMMGLGMVLLVSASTGEYALAGALSATFSLAASFLNPLGSRLADRWGQARVLPVQALVGGTGLLLFTWAVVEGTPTWTLFATAVVSGATQPNIGSLVRARWSAMLSGTPQLKVAFALEAVLDEVIFVVGPPAAALLAATVAPPAPLVLSAALLLVGSPLLAVQRSTQPRPARHDDLPPARSAIREPVVVIIALIMVMLGGFFGSIEVTTVAFAREAGSGLLAGVLLALSACASLVGGLVFGTRTVARSLPTQLAVATTAMALGSAPMAFVSTPWALAIAMVASGVAVAPTMIVGLTIVEGAVESRQMTEAMTWTTTGLTLGLALTATLSGVAIDAHGASAGYAVGAAAAVGAAVLAWALRRPLRTVAHAEVTPVLDPRLPADETDPRQR